VRTTAARPSGVHASAADGDGTQRTAGGVELDDVLDGGDRDRHPVKRLRRRESVHRQRAQGIADPPAGDSQAVGQEALRHEVASGVSAREDLATDERDDRVFEAVSGRRLDGRAVGSSRGALRRRGDGFRLLRVPDEDAVLVVVPPADARLEVGEGLSLPLTAQCDERTEHALPAIAFRTCVCFDRRGTQRDRGGGDDQEIRRV
jgi:hypothetical protein